MDSEFDWEILIDLVRQSAEFPTTFYATERYRGQWMEIVEQVHGESDAYAYWVAFDPGMPAGYKVLDHPDQNPTAMDLDLKHLVDNDGEA